MIVACRTNNDEKVKLLNVETECSIEDFGRINLRLNDHFATQVMYVFTMVSILFFLIWYLCYATVTSEVFVVTIFVKKLFFF